MNGRALFTRMHVFWYKLSGGRLLGNFGRAPVLLLTTIGRKTGKSRTTPLLYIQDEERVAIAASNGGRDKDPSWWTNLKHNPRATIQIKGAKRTVTAREASRDEKDMLWPRLAKMYPQYDDYQRKTKREIPVVILTPAEPTSVS